MLGKLLGCSRIGKSSLDIEAPEPHIGWGIALGDGYIEVLVVELRLQVRQTMSRLHGTKYLMSKPYPVAVGLDIDGAVLAENSEERAGHS